MTVIRPQNLQTIITKKAGHVIPDGLFEKILQHKPTAFGYVVQDTGGELAIEREDADGLTLENLKELQRNTVDFPSMLYFGELVKGYHVDDIQPFVLADANDKPFMAIFIEGDFPKYNDGNGRTDEFHLFNKIIHPTLMDIVETADGDISKILAKLGQPLFNNNFQGHIGHRGALAIMPYEGDAIVIGKNELGETYDWGTTSQRHGFGDVEKVPEPVKEEPKAEPAKKFSFKKGPSTPAPDVKDAATPGTEPRASVPATPVAVKQNGNTTVVDTKPQKSTDIIVRLPSWCHKNEDIKAFYEIVFGARPQNWKKRVPVISKIPEDQIPQSLEQLHQIQAEKLKAQLKDVKASPTSTASLAPHTGNDIKAQREVAKPDIGSADDNLPIIDAKTLEKALDFVAKHLDGQSNQMPNPIEIQAMEKKFPSFSESLGMKPHEILNWPVSGLFALAKLDPRLPVILAIEMRALWRATLKAEDLVGTSKTTATKTEGTTKTESVAQTPPAKKFSFKKAG